MECYQRQIKNLKEDAKIKDELVIKLMMFYSMSPAVVANLEKQIREEVEITTFKGDPTGGRAFGWFLLENDLKEAPEEIREAWEKVSSHLVSQWKSKED